MTAIDEFTSKIDYLNIDKNKKEVWNKVKNSVLFRNMGNPEIFLLALVLGLKHGKREKILNSSNLFRIRELRENVWIPLSIGFSELNDAGIFETKESARMAFKVCEEYANSGIDILNNLIKKQGFIIELIDDLLKNTIKA